MTKRTYPNVSANITPAEKKLNDKSKPENRVIDSEQLDAIKGVYDATADIPMLISAMEKLDSFAAYASEVRTMLLTEMLEGSKSKVKFIDIDTIDDIRLAANALEKYIMKALGETFNNSAKKKGR